MYAGAAAALSGRIFAAFILAARARWPPITSSDK